MEKNTSIESEELTLYERCSAWCLQHHIKNERHFFAMKKAGLLQLPAWFPKAPRDFFHRRKEWISATHFFSGETRLRKSPYHVCQRICKELGVKNKRHFRALRESGKMPYWVPASPDRYFSHPKRSYNHWEGWHAFLNTTPTKRIKTPISFDECSCVCQTVGIQSMVQYYKMHKNNELPANMPANPYYYFKARGEWKGAYTLLSKSKKVILSFDICAETCKSMQITSLSQYRRMYRNNELPAHMPANPYHTFKRRGEWKGANMFFERT